MSWVRSTIAGLALALSFSGCATPGDGLATSSIAEKPRRIEPEAAISTALQCIHETGVLRHTVIGVGPWVDSTGKGNSVANGATGAFLPQAGTASFVTDTLRRMGATPLVMYFGPAERKVQARFVINGIFNSLDFGSAVDADLRVAGVGPTVQAGWAQLTLTIQMDAAATRLNRQTSVLVRSVRRRFQHGVLRRPAGLRPPGRCPARPHVDAQRWHRLGFERRHARRPGRPECPVVMWHPLE